MDDCIFCRIIRKEIPANIVYEDDDVIVIEDISPQAAIHLLVIPKIHISDIMQIDETSGYILKKMFFTIQKAAVLKDIDKSGFRTIINYGKDAGQSVQHLHFHILGGEFFGEKLL